MKPEILTSSAIFGPSTTFFKAAVPDHFTATTILFRLLQQRCPVAIVPVFDKHYFIYVPAERESTLVIALNPEAHID